jgi:hypothetical protein
MHGCAHWPSCKGEHLSPVVVDHHPIEYKPNSWAGSNAGAACTWSTLVRGVWGGYVP